MLVFHKKDNCITLTDMDEKTPLLNPSELYDKRRSKDASRLRAYNKILEQIQKFHDHFYSFLFNPYS